MWWGFSRWRLFNLVRQATGKVCLLWSWHCSGRVLSVVCQFPKTRFAGTSLRPRGIADLLRAIGRQYRRAVDRVQSTHPFVIGEIVRSGVIR